MTETLLTAEQCGALAMLATAGNNGAAQSLLNAHGFRASLVAGVGQSRACDNHVSEGPSRRQDDRGH